GWLGEGWERYATGELTAGRVRASSTFNDDVRDATYAVLHVGGRDFSWGVRGWEGPQAYDAMKVDLRRRYARYTLAEMVRGMDEWVPGKGFSLTDLFLHQRRRVLTSGTRAPLDRDQETHRRGSGENPQPA